MHRGTHGRGGRYGAHRSPGKTPTFAYVGEHDIECPAPQTQEFWHAMKAMNVPTAIMIYPGEGHGLRDPEHLADAMQRTLAWFDKYLK